MEKTAIMANYKIKINGKKFEIISPDSFFCNNGVFYYTPQETKKLHRQNLKYGWSFLNQAKGFYNQLIGADFEIVNKKVYTRLINLFISYLYDLPEKIRIPTEKIYSAYSLTPQRKKTDWNILINSKNYINYLNDGGVLDYEHEYLSIKTI